MESQDTEEREDAISLLAELVCGAFGDDGAMLGHEVRAAGGVPILARLLEDPSATVQQQTLLVLGNLCTTAVDAGAARTKEQLRKAGASRPLVRFLQPPDRDADETELMLCCGALQNLCDDSEWSLQVMAHGAVPRLEELLTHEQPMVVRYASGTLRNLCLSLNPGTTAPADGLLSSTALKAIRRRAKQAELEQLARTRAAARIKHAASKMSMVARLRRIENNKARAAAEARGDPLPPHLEPIARQRSLPRLSGAAAGSPSPPRPTAATPLSAARAEDGGGGGGVGASAALVGRWRQWRATPTAATAAAAAAPPDPERPKFVILQRLKADGIEASEEAAAAVASDRRPSARPSTGCANATRPAAFPAAPPPPPPPDDIYEPASHFADAGSCRRRPDVVGSSAPQRGDARRCRPRLSSSGKKPTPAEAAEAAAAAERARGQKELDALEAKLREAEAAAAAAARDGRRRLRRQAAGPPRRHQLGTGIGMDHLMINGPPPWRAAARAPRAVPPPPPLGATDAAARRPSEGEAAAAVAASGFRSLGPAQRAAAAAISDVVSVLEPVLAGGRSGPPPQPLVRIDGAARLGAAALRRLAAAAAGRAAAPLTFVRALALLPARGRPVLADGRRRRAVALGGQADAL